MTLQYSCGRIMMVSDIDVSFPVGCSLLFARWGRARLTPNRVKHSATLLARGA